MLFDVSSRQKDRLTRVRMHSQHYRTHCSTSRIMPFLLHLLMIFNTASISKQIIQPLSGSSKFAISSGRSFFCQQIFSSSLAGASNALTRLHHSIVQSDAGRAKKEVDAVGFLPNPVLFLTIVIPA